MRDLVVLLRFDPCLAMQGEFCVSLIHLHKQSPNGSANQPPPTPSPRRPPALPVTGAALKGGSRVSYWTHLIDANRPANTLLRPNASRRVPTAIYNGLIAPLQPMAIKGVIWSQGENDWKRPILYRTLFATMIKDWGQHWGQGDFPFIYAQLAGFDRDGSDCWPRRSARMIGKFGLPRRPGNRRNTPAGDLSSHGRKTRLASAHAAPCQTASGGQRRGSKRSGSDPRECFAPGEAS